MKRFSSTLEGEYFDFSKYIDKRINEKIERIKSEVRRKKDLKEHIEYYAMMIKDILRDMYNSDVYKPQISEQGIEGLTHQIMLASQSEESINDFLRVVDENMKDTYKKLFDAIREESER